MHSLWDTSNRLFNLAPVVATLGAHEYQIHAVFCWVCECHSLLVLAFLADHVLASGQCWILDALLVDEEEEALRVACGTSCHLGRLLLLT